ncbi:hypothetical protein DITRI_Ditri14bG0130900 [Diplodiscus trichospermus]
MLFFHTTTNLEKLNLIVTKYTSRVHRWISAAATLRGVRQLDFCIYNSRQPIKLPDVLFTCKTLLVLKLEIYTALYVPIEVFLPNLKSLDLLCIWYLNDDSIQRLISSCIMLENLLIGCYGLTDISQFNICHPSLKRLTMIFDSEGLSNTWIVIDAPNLVYLEYNANIAAGYSFRNLHSLLKANIALLPAKDVIQTSDLNFAALAELFRGIANVESLMLGQSSMKHLQCQEPLHLFENLVELKIDPPIIRHREKRNFRLYCKYGDFAYELTLTTITSDH